MATNNNAAILINDVQKLHDKMTSNERLASELFGRIKNLSRDGITLPSADTMEQLEIMDDLREDNSELRQALDIIMSKHRLQIAELAEGARHSRKEADRAVNNIQLENAEVHKRNILLQERVFKMMEVLRLASKCESDEYLVGQEEMEALRIENVELRRMLGFMNDSLEDDRTTRRT